MPQKRELMAHGRHGQPESVRKIADAKLVVRESVHQPEAKGVRQRKEDFDGLRRRFVCRERATNLFDLRGIDNLWQEQSHS